MISVTDFFDAASQRHNDVILMPALHRMPLPGNDFVFQQDSAPVHRAGHVQQLNCCETSNVFEPNLWPPNNTDFTPVDYEIWAVM